MSSLESDAVNHVALNAGDRPDLARWRSPLKSFSQARWWSWRGHAVRYYMAYPQQAPHPPSHRGLEATTTTPMLWLHGFGANADQWRWNWAPFHRDRPLYALDFLGFGGSSQAAVTYSVDQWVDQVYDFWQAHIRVPIVLVGHSLGGLVALRLATRYPDVVERLVLLTVPVDRAEVMSVKVNAIASWIEARFTQPWILKPAFYLVRRPQTLRRILRSVYQQHPDCVDDELVQLFSQPPTAWGAARAFCYLAQSRTQADFAPQVGTLLDQLQAPTLVVWGDRDGVIPIAWGRKVVQPHPRITWQELPGAGHCGYDEQPDRVNQMITTWLHPAEGDAIANPADHS